ncbi:hypothetical protein ABZ807_26590 [Micromonospora sp. NPDC047548]|uniref:hypothetical protein n=1 Tax=Micromonospora sp. NPDC047548 TaxID=3155624 RepID=UPI0033CDA76B
MSVRRHMARLMTVGALLGGLVAVGAAPAYADEDRVGVRAASSFNAGGSPGGVSMEVRKRTEGCVLLRSGLGLRLDGLAPDQVKVEVNYGGRWFPVPVSGGGGSVVTDRTSPAKPTLCKGKSITVRYRVAFLAGAPAGRLEVIGEATTAVGGLIGRGADTSRVGGRAAASASPTPSRKPTPSATETQAAVTDEPTQAVLAAPTTGQATAAAEKSSGGSMIMWFGIAMVAVGAGLIALLVRNNRKDRGHADERTAYPGAPVPRNPGPTTYRSDGGAPGATPTPTGQVYGQQAAPARPGGLYGGAGAYPTVSPAPRPAGGMYGAPTSAPPASNRPASAPPATPPGPPPVGHGGDATTFAPRLPG